MALEQEPCAARMDDRPQCADSTIGGASTLRRRPSRQPTTTALGPEVLPSLRAIADKVIA